MEEFEARKKPKMGAKEEIRGMLEVFHGYFDNQHLVSLSLFVAGTGVMLLLYCCCLADALI